MLKHTLLHPAILAAIARAGHHGRIVIADGNYPASTTLGPSAELVSLNLMPGVVDACQVLESILSAVPIDFAYVMDYERTGPYALTEDPPAWHDFRNGSFTMKHGRKAIFSRCRLPTGAFSPT
jgi:L-fucose mutarotase